MWITDVLVGCRPHPAGDGPSPQPSSESAAHSAVAPHHHTGADHTGGVGPGAPGCTGQPAGCVYITGDEPGDYFGSPLTIADVDGDGRVELVVAEPAPNGGPVRTGVHVLTTLQGGVAWNLPGAHYTSNNDLGLFTFVLARDHLMYLSGEVGDCVGPVFPGVASGNLTDEDLVGCLREGGPVLAPQDMTTCVVGGAPATCLSAFLQPTDPPGVFSGAVHVFPAPLTGDVHLADALARYDGDLDDTVEYLTGLGDLSGDGVPDLVVGAHRSGRVAIVHDAPLGVHSLWDVTDTTLHGEVSGGLFGVALTVGDLDGDGATDLFVGAAREARIYGFRGPIGPGDHPASSATWTFEADAGQALGERVAIGDFDGDGRPDAAVVGGAGAEPGWVAVYLAPPPGRVHPSSAAVLLGSGIGVDDGIGQEIAAGDLDGDGRADLAVGAFLDPVFGRGTGSVLVFPGGGVP